MSETKMNLEQEALRATEMLKGKVVVAVIRHNDGEVILQFAGGTRLFVNHTSIGVELSITGGN